MNAQKIALEMIVTALVSPANLVRFLVQQSLGCLSNGGRRLLDQDDGCLSFLAGCAGGIRRSARMICCVDPA